MTPIRDAEDDAYWYDDNGQVYSTFEQCHDKDYCVFDGYSFRVYGLSNPKGQTSTIENYVNDYVSKLNSNISGANASGRLIYLEELVSLGCKWGRQDGEFVRNCYSAPSWVYQTSYSIDLVVYEYIRVVQFDGKIEEESPRFPDDSGLRPVITINTSVIE